MEKFFAIVITIILIFWIIKLLMRLLMPFIMRRMVKRMQNRMQDQFTQQFGQFNQYNNSTEETHAEGDVKIQYPNQKQTNDTSISDELGGEYVDFEEIK